MHRVLEPFNSLTHIYVYFLHFGVFGEVFPNSSFVVGRLFVYNKCIGLYIYDLLVVLGKDLTSDWIYPSPHIPFVLCSVYLM